MDASDELVLTDPVHSIIIRSASFHMRCFTWDSERKEYVEVGFSVLGFRVRDCPIFETFVT